MSHIYWFINSTLKVNSQRLMVPSQFWLWSLRLSASSLSSSVLILPNTTLVSISIPLSAGTCFIASSIRALISSKPIQLSIIHPPSSQMQAKDNVQLVTQAQAFEDYVDYVTTGKQTNIAPIPFRTLESFDIEQRMAMEKLKRFSPHYAYLEKITPTVSQMATKQMFVKENLVYLDSEKLRTYNMERQRYKSSFFFSGIAIVSSFAGTFFYQAITKAATRSAIRPAMKAALVAGVVSLGFIQYQKGNHDKVVNQFFLEITNEKMQSK